MARFEAWAPRDFGEYGRYAATWLQPPLTMCGISLRRHGHGPCLFFYGQAKHRSNDGQNNASPPNYCIASRCLVNIAAHPDTDETPDLMAQEHDARQRGRVAQTIYLPDKPLR